jgi:hypothetical protein
MQNGFSFTVMHNLNQFTLFQSIKSYLCLEQAFWKLKITLLEGDQHILAEMANQIIFMTGESREECQGFKHLGFSFSFTGKRRRNSLKPKGDCNFNNHSHPPLLNRIWLKCNFKFFIRKERKNVIRTRSFFFFST